MILSLPAYLVKALVRGYQIALSPFLPKSCRFSPSCSAYALLAYERYGFFRATYLSIYRILRCNPFCKGGYDPLP
ncbi:MAG: membrane protein insertion efficiency factor YidD [Candidatus Cloacimonetes bacterium]|jgi:putative membrane protein insertion efficiency factor|nr:membrane protein insertion efficiency factor YidD [Candidatus Cloacimonadota bacterium]NLO43881.1 membrane protein insertion efficiency factor YidD [Candidatus Cloacimonadota bacterium]